MTQYPEISMENLHDAYEAACAFVEPAQYTHLGVSMALAAGVAALPKDGPDWEGFGRAIMEEWQEHGDIEASEKFDLAVRYKILVPIPGGFDPETHVDNYGEAEPGEPWYQLV